MSIDADVDFKASVSLGLGKIETAVATVDKRMKDQLRLSQFPRQLPLFLPFTTNIIQDMGQGQGPADGRLWQVRLAGVVALNSTNNAFSTFPSAGTGTSVSNTFAAAAAGSVSLPAGASISGFTVDLQAGTATDYVVTVTNAVGGTMSFNVQGAAGGTTFTQTFNPPIPALTPGSQITVNVPAQAGGPAYSIEANGVTGATTSPLVTFYAGQNVASPGTGMLPAGQIRWQMTTVPSWENFSADQFRIGKNEHLLVGVTGITAGTTLMVITVINDIRMDAGESVTIGA